MSDSIELSVMLKGYTHEFILSSYTRPQIFVRFSNQAYTLVCSWKIWWELNLADWSQLALNLADSTAGTLHAMS